uniref:Peptidase A2 domain-containing protein n=1 Tax=Heligmosomoides polygyrus TaxID=6339 RepID=A0A183F3P7_HELPZ
LRVNGIHVLALIDTGGLITVITAASAALFGVFHFSDKKMRKEWKGSRFALGWANLHFDIGSLSFGHLVHFTEAARVTSATDSYNIIMGNDLLLELPP